ncbi:MAG TPA: hypothetical protein DD381_12085 [Lentisphaeria bacterium]|nr:hypothetical protein [Lentisphaeria bacterium]
MKYVILEFENHFVIGITICDELKIRRVDLLHRLLLIAVESSKKTHQLSIINYQLSIINYQFSIFHYPPFSHSFSIFNFQFSIELR